VTNRETVNLDYGDVPNLERLQQFRADLLECVQSEEVPALIKHVVSVWVDSLVPIVLAVRSHDIVLGGFQAFADLLTSTVD